MMYDEVSGREWEEIVLKSDNAYFFHSPLWAKIMEKTYPYHVATRLYNINGKKILVPMMKQEKYGLKNFTSMPGNKDQGGFFSVSSVTVDDFKLIVNDIVGGRNLSFSLALPPFMGLSDGEDDSPVKEDWEFKDEWNYVHLLNLEGKDFEDIWKNDFHKKTRGSIRKAKKSGVKIRDAMSLDDFKTFYDILLGASKKWGLEAPPVPFKLLENLYKYGSSHVNLSLAVKDDRIIAGLLYFTYSKTVYFYLSSFLPEYGTFNPLSLLYSESIERVCMEGYKYVNLGPSGNLNHIKKIKERLGAEKVEINRYRVYSKLAKILNKINRSKSVN